jgi:hypothetical protein
MPTADHMFCWLPWLAGWLFPAFALQVRSTTLDVKVWEPSVVGLFQQLGNEFANQVWEGAAGGGAGGSSGRGAPKGSSSSSGRGGVAVGAEGLLGAEKVIETCCCYTQPRGAGRATAMPALCLTVT